MIKSFETILNEIFGLHEEVTKGAGQATKGPTTGSFQGDYASSNRRKAKPQKKRTPPK